jgi:hypothetical protein
MKRVKSVGLDVRAETIAIAVAEPGGEVRSLGVIPNREDSVRKLVKKLGPLEEPRFCYEAGPTGYVLYWQLTRMGAKCRAETVLQGTTHDTERAEIGYGEKTSQRLWSKKLEEGIGLMARHKDAERLGARRVFEFGESSLMPQR